MLGSRSRLLALVSVAALSAPAWGAGSASAADDTRVVTRQVAPATAPFTLWAPSTVTAYGYGKHTWTDLGLRVIAQGAPFELWSTRASYSQRIRTVWRSAAGDVALPTGAMTDFSGLPGFLRLTITPARGGKVVVVNRPVCFNGASERIRPTARPTSPYPDGCWNNPFSLGSVQGVQQGWATSFLSGDRPLRIGAGRYVVRVQVAPRYVRLFGLAPAQSTRTVRLVVKNEEDVEDRTSVPRARVARPAAHPPTGPERRVAGPTPDLRSLPAWGISLSRNDRYLRFSATVWNAGDSPLVVDGFRQRGKDLMDAYQYFFDAAGNQTGYQSVGDLHWDAKPSHQHWHFEDFARYSLLRKNKTEAARSKKEAFCLANTDAVDLTVPGAAWKPDNTDLATSCGDQTSLSIREVLAAGWGDTYTQYRAGQSFRVDRLPNGVYFIAVAANPDGNLVEESTANNVALRRIRLGGTPTKRTLSVAQVGIIKDEGYGGTG